MLNNTLDKALRKENFSLEESLLLWQKASTAELMYVANELRKQWHPNNKVTWLIDRNVNYTNICMSGCKFCSFFCTEKSPRAYITSKEEYEQKIQELVSLGGDQLLLQGGMHPNFGLKFYTDLFKTLKSIYPQLKLHALGPPEIIHISTLENISYRETLIRLQEAGLDSLPGAGAEILSDRVRSIISPRKFTVKQWLDVMREAHKLNITTSATMVFGHIETIEERILHLLYIRDVQNEKPEHAKGFISFIPWTMKFNGTQMEKYNIKQQPAAEEYIRMIALSRIVLNNIPNIQPSSLTVGKETAQICLHAGANDFGSIMIEENVVSPMGSAFKFDKEGIQLAIREAGFEPQRRNQQFEFLN